MTQIMLHIKKLYINNNLQPDNNNFKIYNYNKAEWIIVVAMISYLFEATTNVL